MSEPQRYSPFLGDEGGPCMEPDLDGKFVRADDPAYIESRRMAEAFCAIAARRVSIDYTNRPDATDTRIVVESQSIAVGALDLMLAIESALSVDRQTPKGTFGTPTQEGQQ